MAIEKVRMEQVIDEQGNTAVIHPETSSDNVLHMGGTLGEIITLGGKPQTNFDFVARDDKTIEKIRVNGVDYPFKGEKGEQGPAGTASVAIDDNVINLQQTWSSEKIKEFSTNNLYNRNSSKKLNIACYDGDNQAIHPSVLYFKNGWNGYKFWMAYTPYTNMDEFVENPSVAVSNDGITWKEPKSGINPLDKIEEADRGKKHNSDTNLVYREDLNRLEIWWRQVDRTVGTTYLFRVLSTDGKIWSSPQKINNNWGVCPIVKFEDGKYKLWVYASSENGLRYGEATEPDFDFGKARVIDTHITEFEEKNYKLWHFDIRKNKYGLYEMLGSYKAVEDTSGETQHIFYSFSEDNLTYSKPSIFMKTGRMGNFDSKMQYTPSFVDVDGKKYIYHSAKSIDGSWGTGLSISDTHNVFGAVGLGNFFVSGYESDEEVIQQQINRSLENFVTSYIPERTHPNGITPKNNKVGKIYIDTTTNKLLYLLALGGGYWSKNLWVANQQLPNLGYKIRDEEYVFELIKTGSTGTTKPSFNKTFEGITDDGSVQWKCLGRSATICDSMGNVI